MEKTYRPVLTEMIASFIFVLTVTGAFSADVMSGGNIGWVGIALANVFVFTALLTFTMHSSGGHISPAVTIGHFFAGRIGIQTAMFYIAAQLVGALVAGLVTRGMFPASAWEPVLLGTPVVGSGVSTIGAVLIELLFTCIFVACFLACMSDERISKNAAPWAVGCALGFCTLVAGPLTGAALNPARSFGAAAGSGYWTDQWVYWVGPILGAIVAPYLVRLAGGKVTKAASSPWAELSHIIRPEAKVGAR
ncbi:MAG: aquaporin [candidate division Zixibacteria bacterium]|nr:aquaporin [candidate division Zixibacteria bacterium]